MTSEASIYREFGDQSRFAIVCVHEPLGSEPCHVYGRMCIRAGDKILGDFDESACMLNVTASHLQAILERLPKIDSDTFQGENEAFVWKTIDKAIYQDDDRSKEEVVADSERYFRYDFLTNGGESFDNSKSFIVRDGNTVSILFKMDDNVLKCIAVDVDTFRIVVKGFLDWIDSGGI
jgi:hypothetical protein